MTYLRRLRQWSHRRPTLGGICLVISAVLIGLPTLSGFRIGDMILSVSSISGVSTVWLSALMALCAVAVLFWRHTRVLAGISALVIAVVAFPAANFGGYLFGTLFGILGAAFTLAWRPLADHVEDSDDDSDGGADKEPAERAEGVADESEEGPVDPATVSGDPSTAPLPSVVDLDRPPPGENRES